MKKNLTLFLCLIISGITATAQPLTQWQKLLGGVNDDNFNYNIQQTNDGGYITAGEAQSSNTGTLTGLTNHGGYDGWIVKTDANGVTQWQRLLGGSNDDYIFSIQQTYPDNGYIVAGYSSSSNTGTLTGITNNGGTDGWIIKLDASGNTVWQRLAGGSGNDYLFWIRQATDGYIMAGQSFSSNSGTLTGVTNHGSMDGWVIKLNVAGTVTQWQLLLGGNDDDYFRGIEQTSDLGYIVTCASTTSNSGTLTGFIGHGASDAWIVKLDAGGVTQWQKLLGGGGIDNLITIQQSTDKGYIAAGYSNSPNDGTLTGLINNGGMDGWIIKLDSSGNTVWQKLLGGINDDWLPGIQQTTDGGYIVAGYASSSNTGTLTGFTNNGGNDGWLIKISAAGNTQWQNLLGGNTHDYFNGVYQASDGGFIAKGTSYSSNTGTLTGVINNGSSDGWIIKFVIPKVTVKSYDTLASCSSTNSISFKATNGTAPYSVQLYRFGVAYGSPVVTSQNANFHNLPVGSYYAIATSNSVPGTSKTVNLVSIPTNLTTTNIQSTKAKLNWTIISCANYYSIQYRVHGTTAWTKKKTTGNVNSYTLKNLIASTIYDWEVAAVDSANGITATGKYTDSVVFTTSASFPGNQSQESDDLTTTGSGTIQLITMPNPATSSFKIQFSTTINSKITAVLIDMNGRTAWSSGTIDAFSLNGKQVNASRFMAGTYLLQIVDDKGQVISKTKVVIDK